jgi:hypothetical protein
LLAWKMGGGDEKHEGDLQRLENARKQIFS